MCEKALNHCATANTEADTTMLLFRINLSISDSTTDLCLTMRTYIFIDRLSLRDSSCFRGRRQGRQPLNMIIYDDMLGYDKYSDRGWWHISPIKGYWRGSRASAHGTTVHVLSTPRPPPNGTCMNAIPPVLATTEALTHIFALLTRRVLTIFGRRHQ